MIICRLRAPLLLLFPTYFTSSLHYSTATHCVSKIMEERGAITTTTQLFQLIYNPVTVE